MSSLQGLLPVILVSGLAVCLITLVNTDFGIIILIFSMLLSPELRIAQIGYRGVVVRIDDILLFVVFFTWLAKMAMNKELGLLKKTPLNLPIISFIFISTLSTFLGIISGTVKAAFAFFYILKYIEYFLLYFMVVNNISNFKQIKRFIAILFIVCVLVSLSTYPQIARQEKTSAPFEGLGGAEPNTLGGYQVLLLAVSAGILLYTKSIFWQFLSVGLILCTLPSFLYTLSRGSYLGFIFMYLFLIIFSKKKQLLLIMILLFASFILPSILPKIVTNRIAETFIPGKEYEFVGKRITLDESASARIENWKSVLEKLTRRPILGYGVTGVGLVDTQYARVMGETGIVGFWIFTWILITISRICLRSLKNVGDDWSQGLIIGFLAGFAGLLIHAFSAESFIIVRIMEPFWFLVAIIMAMSWVFINSEKGALK